MDNEKDAIERESGTKAKSAVDPRVMACPFCGKSDNLHVRPNYVACNSCMAMGPDTDEMPEGTHPVEVWNRRRRENVSELIRIAACLLQLVPSDLVDDYPQKTYSAGRVARMMERPSETAKMLAYQLRQVADRL